jgi:hypothetical protein
MKTASFSELSNTNFRRQNATKARPQSVNRKETSYLITPLSPNSEKNMRSWLASNCEGKWRIENLKSSQVQSIKFERPSDLANLTRMLDVYWPNWLN